MTYQELLEKLQALTPEQLNKQAYILIYDHAYDEYVCEDLLSFGKTTEGDPYYAEKQTNSNYLEVGRPIFFIYK